jgi:hypothetical protein
MDEFITPVSDVTRDGFREVRFEIELPGDLGVSMEEMVLHAIEQAREGFSEWAVPAEWRAHKESGEIGDAVIKFSVTRLSGEVKR